MVMSIFPISAMRFMQIVFKYIYAEKCIENRLKRTTDRDRTQKRVAARRSVSPTIATPLRATTAFVIDSVNWNVLADRDTRLKWKAGGHGHAQFPIKRITQNTFTSHSPNKWHMNEIDLV